MKVYRLEMPDGGGPFFTLDGVQRRTGVKLPSADFACGCPTLEKLNEYFNKCSNIPQECKVVIREIPDEFVMYSEDQVIFPKRFIKEVI